MISTTARMINATAVKGTGSPAFTPERIVIRESTSKIIPRNNCSIPTTEGVYASGMIRKDGANNEMAFNKARNPPRTTKS